MSRYRKIEVSTWGDAKFMQLSPIPPCGQGLWLYLLTGPHTSVIPGLFRSGQAALAESLDWPPEALALAIGEAIALGMIEVNAKAKVMWISKAIFHNPPASLNVVKAWASELEMIPECELKNEAIECIKSFLSNMGPSFLEAFMPSGMTKPKAKRMPKRMARAIQKQEQEQELPPTPFGENSDLIILGIAQAYPKTSHLRNPDEITSALFGAIIKAIDADGTDDVLRGTKFYAKTVAPDKREFCLAPERFFGGFEYRAHLPKVAAQAMNPAERTRLSIEASECKS